MINLDMNTYVYLDDVFIGLPYSYNEIIEAFNIDKMKPFKLIEDLVKSRLGDILDVELYSSYFNPPSGVFVIEYFVRFEGKSSSGRVGVKIIHAEDPSKALMEYYRAEKSGEILRY